MKENLLLLKYLLEPEKIYKYMTSILKNVYNDKLIDVTSSRYIDFEK